ncbi:ariadne-2 isoform X2 [Brachionus plicatilis]|uniref:RBR-type E3 ubiquitin transferase n=1 Tax=Brachionus plicatilis TaxID=10195 RepID=A0A3M7SGK9_BRAPC|nr:ariadne-2 isoform X2 [Brachionus plicatilis]
MDWSIMEQKCQNVSSVLKLDEPLDALYLLKQFNWNPQTILNEYNKDPSSFVKSYFSDDNNNNSKKTSPVNKTSLVSYLNIFNENKLTSLASHSFAIKSNELEACCQICYCAKSGQEMMALEQCGHLFCVDCWKMHFESLVNNASGHFFECMQTKCSVVAGKNFVLECLKTSDVNLMERYKNLVVNDLINESEDLQVCPGEIHSVKGNSQFSTPRTHVANTGIRLTSTVTSTPTVSFTFKTESPEPAETVSQKCDSVVWLQSKPGAKRVMCTNCDTQFCFLCATPYHAPNNCSTIRKWNLKCQDDSETRNYLLVHTQDCPKCKVCIEKNGGCSHMTCNRCKHEFCWVCGNDWKTHGPTYDCNRYKGNPEQDTAREALNRYTHYYHRWINHSNSLKFEKALRQQCLLKIQHKIMNKEGGTLVDWEFLIEAVDVLTRARYTLQYTYPYAYYLDNNETKMLFENIQAELEREVENLSHSLEKVNLNDKFNIRIQMSIVEKRRRTFTATSISMTTELDLPKDILDLEDWSALGQGTSKVADYQIKMHNYIRALYSTVKKRV